LGLSLVFVLWTDELNVKKSRLDERNFIKGQNVLRCQGQNFQVTEERSVNSSLGFF